MRLFPPEEKQGDIHFVFAKALPYRLRMRLVIGLLAAGVLAQVLVQFWIGWCLLVIAMGLGMIKGYKAIVPVKRGEEKWHQVTPDEYRKVQRTTEQLREWDQDALDITNVTGGFVFVLVLAAVVAIGLALAARQPQWGLYWVANCLVVLLPHWLIGVRQYLKKDRLLVKVRLLQAVLNKLEALSQAQVLPMLSTLEGAAGGQVPQDARLMIRLVGAPGWFLGIQVQISINVVQGSDYPYLYCVLIAKPEGKMLHCLPRVKGFDKDRLVIESEVQSDANIIVVRQRTTQSSGYHTKPKQAERVVRSALDLAERLCAMRAGAAEA